MKYFNFQNKLSLEKKLIFKSLVFESMVVAFFFVLQSCSMSDIKIKGRLKQNDESEAAALAKVNFNQSVLGRNVGPELEPQFRAIFPNKNIPSLSYLAYKKLVRDGGVSADFEIENPAVKPLNDPSRSQGVSSQLAWEKLVDQLCVNTTDRGAEENSNILFKADDDLLLGSNESYPTDADTKKIFIAVRRAWRAPLKETEPAIVSLKKNYLAVKAKLGNEGADRALCEAVLLSPQFWLGAGGASEPARKVYQRLANRLPTIKELEAYTTGKSTLADIVKSIQKNEESKYLDNIWRWHDWQYGFNTNMFSNYVGNTTFFGVTHGMNGPAGGLYSTWPMNFTMWGMMLTEEGGKLNSQKFTALGMHCDGGDEAFDPRTNGFAYYYNGQLLARRLLRDTPGLGNGDQSFNVGGETFSPNDFSQQYQYSTPSNPVKCNDDGGTGGCGQFHFADGTKFQRAFGGQNRDKYDSFRIYRITPEGKEQRGTSRIKMYYGDEISVCNSFIRPMLTCGGFNMPGDVTGGNITVNPGKFNNLYCGRPDTNAMKSLTTGYEVPRGYDVNQALDASKLNDVMIAQPSMQFFGDFREYLWTKQRQVGNQMYPYMQILDDLHREPERFVKYLIKNNKDYRELITANWTIGSEYYKLFIASNGMPIMAYPPGYEKYYDSNSRASLSHRYSESELSNALITSKDFQPLSANYFYKNGVNAVRNKENMAFDLWMDEDKKTKDMNEYVLWKSQAEFSPRPLSGILTMPAFIQPTAIKARTYSARIFQRVLCRLPSEVAVPAGAQEAHKKFIPTREPGGNKHVDPNRGCFSCHMGLDPLAAAVSGSFMTRVGETTMTDFLGELFTSGGIAFGDKSPDVNGIRWGSYNSRGEGMFQGKSIRGFQELGKAVAESDEFSDCAVTTAFKNVYGRDPSEEDLKIIAIVKKKFKQSGYNYNQMISDLVTSPMFSVAN